MDNQGEHSTISRASEIFFRCLTFEDEGADDFFEELGFLAQALELTRSRVRIVGTSPKPFTDSVFGEVMGLRRIGNRHAVVLNGREYLGPEFGRQRCGHTLDG